jgi:hypothetical protein
VDDRHWKILCLSSGSHEFSQVSFNALFDISIGILLRLRWGFMGYFKNKGKSVDLTLLLLSFHFFHDGKLVSVWVHS